MNKQSGHALEDLVRRIESHLLPEGYSVRMNERTFDEDGTPVGEFDIIIEGPVGSSNVKWLIECRDRPSVGKAPASWLQQLIGRRVQFHFDRVFAVSTTGFSNGAKRLAAREHIYLRTVSKIEDIEADFKMREFAIFSDSIEAVEELAAKPREPRDIEIIDLTNPLFRLVGDPDYQTLHDFVFRNLERQRGPQLALIPPREGTFSLRFSFKGNFEIKAGERILDAVLIDFQLKVRRDFYQGKALAVQQYDEDGRPISQVGEFVVEFPTGPVKYTMFWLKGADGRESIVIEGVDKTPGKITSAFLITEPSSILS